MLNQLQLNHQRERDFAVAEAIRLASVRDDSISRYQFGLATINAASVVAILASLGSLNEALPFGLDPFSLKLAILAFVAGVVAAGVAILFTQNNLIERAGSTSARATTLSTLIDLSADNRRDDGRYKELSDKRDALLKDSLEYSTTAIYAQSASCGLWIVGVACPIVKILRALF